MPHPTHGPQPTARTGPAQVSRRTFLGGLGAVAGSAFLPVVRSTSELTPSAFTSSGPVTAAMHVHASWSEGMASWEAQFAQAQSVGCNLIYLTDHDFRAVAWNYLPNLDGVPYTTSATGSFRARTSTWSGSGLNLVSESANSGPAQLVATVQEKPTSWNRLRTSIAGTVLQHTMSGYSLTGGATYEVVLMLSLHPARSGRPAGQFSLRYRYGPAAAGRHTENSGLTGVVELGRVAPGSVQSFDLVADAKQFWPDVHWADHGLQLLRFVVTSPRSGARADVRRGAVRISRTGHTEAAITAQQADLVSLYGPRFPGLTMEPAVEISRLSPHVNAFGVPQFFPDQAGITPSNKDTSYPRMSAQVHAQGGLVSWNHPFGDTAGPQLSAADQAAKRRSVFADMLARRWYGVDILEVGYTSRGSAGTQAHLDLWDTFSRRAIFLTGNGVNDDHIGKNWAGLGNGWVTGVWANDTERDDVIPALTSGRVYTRHAGRWRNGQIDLLVDGAVPMGKAAIADVSSRSLQIFAANLPTGSTVQVVRGPVDGTGTDPGTSAGTPIAASAFSAGSHVVARSVDTTSSCFVRAQVRDSSGALIGTSNPVWLLRSTPARSIPTARRA